MMGSEALRPERIRALLEPYVGGEVAGGIPVTDQLIEQLTVYLDLLLRWNARTNLTAIREPGEIVRRHFGESLFAAARLRGTGTLLDLGSGAGFPGIPIQLCHPGLLVTLAESQSKKATFLREVMRVLGLQTEVWSARVELLRSHRMFDTVVMRAVDRPAPALQLGWELSGSEMWVLGSSGITAELPPGLREVQRWPVPGSSDSCLFRFGAVSSTWNIGEPA